jgi:tRNA(adenine34) deaminase
MTTQLQNNFMREAIQEAKQAKQLGDWPFGAVVVCNDRIIGRGRAMDKTTGDVTDHAEMVALRAACRDLKTNDLQNCTIYCQ